MSDLYLWIQALHSGAILPPAALEKMLTPYKEDYACGWYILRTERGTRCVQHGGATPWFGCYIRHFVDEDVLVLLTTNRTVEHSWQVTWGLCTLVLGEKPLAPPPPPVVRLPDEQLELLRGTYVSDREGRLVVERTGIGFSVSSEGQHAVDALMGLVDASDAETPARFVSERDRAETILRELLDGKVDLLGADLLPGIPKTWPDTVLHQIWPSHLAAWGPLDSHREIGARHDVDSGRTRVWIRLHHRGVDRALELAFVGEKLSIFDLEAAHYPLSRVYAPLSPERLVSYSFAGDSLPEITIERDAEGRASVLRVHVGEQSVLFRRAPANESSQTRPAGRR